MLIPGLVSVTFRQRSVEQIVELVVQAGLNAIEWGGDIHVPHGDLARARQARQMTEGAGLTVAAYGSYYRVGDPKSPDFDDVLVSAVELGAPTVRVWAGRRGSRDADEAYRQAVVDDARRVADLAEGANVKLAFEFHGNTLTDTSRSATQLFQQVDHPAVCSYWQPPLGASVDDARRSLRDVLPWLSNVHVFHWKPGTSQLLALADGAEAWRSYIDAIQSTRRDHFMLIEFVRDGVPENFFEDAAALKHWLTPTQSRP